MVFLWGFTGILGELISLDAVPLVTYRMSIAVLTIYLFLKFKKVDTSISGPMRWKLYAAGFVIALHWVTFFHAIKISTVSVALACMGSGALFASILEPIFFKRKIALSEILLGLSVAFGIFLIANAETDYYAGIAVALFSAFLSASFSVINGLLVKKATPAVITVHELLGGVIAVGIFMLISTAVSGADFSSLAPTSLDIVYLLILGTVATAYAFIQSVEVMKHLSPFTVILTINMEPVYGIIMAYFIIGKDEKMSQEFYIGTLVILASVVVNGYIKRRRKRRTRVELT